MVNCSNYLSSATSKEETSSQDPGHFLELLASSQARRLDDQRASLSHFPGLRLSTCSPPHIPSTSSTEPAPSPGNGVRGPALFDKPSQVPADMLTFVFPHSNNSCCKHKSHTLPLQSSRGQCWSAWSRRCLFRHVGEVPGEKETQYQESVQKYCSKWLGNVYCLKKY